MAPVKKMRIPAASPDLLLVSMAAKSVPEIDFESKMPVLRDGMPLHRVDGVALSIFGTAFEGARIYSKSDLSEGVAPMTFLKVEGEVEADFGVKATVQNFQGQAPRGNGEFTLRLYVEKLVPAGAVAMSQARAESAKPSGGQ